MDNRKTTNLNGNNQNIMEKQIFSMLENVLNEDEDSDNALSIEDSNHEEELNQQEVILNQNNLAREMLSDKDRNLLSNQKLESNGDKHKQNFNNNSLEHMKKNLGFNKNNLNLNQINNNNYIVNPNVGSTAAKGTQNNNLSINFNNQVKKINQPQIFINNVPVVNENEVNDNREFYFPQNKLNLHLNNLQNNNSPHASGQMPHFNNLSPISKQMKNNNSPRNPNEDNLFRNKNFQINNRLTLAHIGMNRPYNIVQKSSSGNLNNYNTKPNLLERNNTINNPTATKLSLNNNNENNTSGCINNR